MSATNGNGQHRQSSKAKRGRSVLLAPPVTASDGPSNTGHDAQHRFRKGNKVFVANPFARRMPMLCTAALVAVTEEDMREVVRKLVEQAKAGDREAAKLLLAQVTSCAKKAKRAHSKEQERDQLAAEIRALEAELARREGRE